MVEGPFPNLDFQTPEMEEKHLLWIIYETCKYGIRISNAPTVKPNLQLVIY